MGVFYVSEDVVHVGESRATIGEDRPLSLEKQSAVPRVTSKDVALESLESVDGVRRTGWIPYSASSHPTIALATYSVLGNKSRSRSSEGG